MKVFVILSAFLAVAVAQYGEPSYAPIPYSFTYEAPTEDGGSSSRTESGDGAGRVQGSYTVNDLEGNSRVVEYIADEAGFRVLALRTNEPGTANQNPADVNIESSAGGAPAGGRPFVGVSPPAVRAFAMGPPVTAPQAARSMRGGANARYVLVPVTDPRARGYY